MKMKKVFAFFVATILASNFASMTTYAHNTTDCGLKHSVKTTYWDIYENTVHWSSYATKMTVDCGDFEGGDFETYINDAVTYWDSVKFNGSDLMSMEIDNKNGCVLFKDKTAEQIAKVGGNTVWAITCRTGAITDETKYNHYSTGAGSVEIWVNWTYVSGKSDRSKKHVPLHELGHVIGLVDIPGSVSVNSYLMCCDWGSTAPITITIADARGAAVILGQHQHNVSSIPLVKYDETRCKRTCSLCKAYNYYKHSFSNNVCRWCGYKKTTTSSIGDYENYDTQIYENVGGDITTDFGLEPEVVDVGFDDNTTLYPDDLPYAPAETSETN